MKALVLKFSCAGLALAALVSFVTLNAHRSSAGTPVVSMAKNSSNKSNEKESDRFAESRRTMVRKDLRSRGIKDESTLKAMGSVQRQLFVPDDRRDHAYDDAALKIGHEQTISRPFIVALMTELVRPTANCRVLDVGTGSGYQAAVLGEICKEVYSIEIVPQLAETAKDRLAKMGYKNVTVRCGDGYRGWPEKAPFDVIVVAAAPDSVPQALIDQLAPGGRLVIPVGEEEQKLLLLEKQDDGKVTRREVLPVKFVPMTGEAQKSLKGDERRKS